MIKSGYSLLEGGIMFSLEWFYQLHMYLVLAGLVSVMAGLYIVKFKKEKKWRIKRHKQLAGLGALLILGGLIVMVLGKETEGLKHMSVPHAFGGLTAMVILLVTITLANLGLRGNKKLLKLHKVFGRISAGLILVVSAVGLTVIISYI